MSAVTRHSTRVPRSEGSGMTLRTVRVLSGFSAGSSRINPPRCQWADCAVLLRRLRLRRGTRTFHRRGLVRFAAHNPRQHHGQRVCVARDGIPQWSRAKPSLQGILHLPGYSIASHAPGTLKSSAPMGTRLVLGRVAEREQGAV